MGNVIGSSISNTLGAFALGLIFSPTATMHFDRSSKIYTGVALGVTLLFILISLGSQTLGRFGGVVLVLAFVVYVASIAWAIYRGQVTAPEDSDSDSDSDSSDDDSDSDSDSESDFGDEESGLKLSNQKKTPGLIPPEHFDDAASSVTLTSQDDLSAPLTKDGVRPTPLAIVHKGQKYRRPASQGKAQKKGPRSTFYHLAQLIFGFLALSLSAYILSHSLSTLAAQFSVSSTTVGLTLLSIATTLPEKLVAVFSARAHQPGVMVANTAGSNIFLVTLCAGVFFLGGNLAPMQGDEAVRWWELATLVGSCLCLLVVVWVGGKRWMGWAMLGMYILFLAAEVLTGRALDD